ncbi:hypothetical protein K2173_025072 [Erythroxylum novogranatense]|uniref:AP2/ERF domain-containing protein n=1 Tax=Erythroxylum novogranatense TaxID=1862640 RepID=A0AAV8SW90_9ROSI|nr:hypothetical protein K2173_025072 [Erythroxylum novogranatense]
MKRSPANSSCSSYSSSTTTTTSSSSSSSCIGTNVPPGHQSAPAGKPRSKRARKSQNQQDKLQNGAISSRSGRSSIYRGVTRHRWTGRFEAHLWDKSSWNNIQNKKGKQVYLGAYDNEEAAAHTYDLAALKYWGPETTLNFAIETYTKELEEMQKVRKEEYLASLRRRSSGFSRGVSKYRGVARHHHNGRWEARIGRVFGNKYLYLGTYNTQEEAAAAYDMAAIEYRGSNAVTNFDISNYIDQLKKKGVPLDHILHEPPTNSSTESEDAEAEVEQPPPPPPSPQPAQQLTTVASPPYKKQQEEHHASLPQLLAPCMESSSLMAMDTMEGQDQDLTWGFCLESLSVPELSLGIGIGCELPDLFNDRGFEENIDMIFDACSYENGTQSQTECASDNSGCGLVEIEDVSISESRKEGSVSFDFSI